MRPKHFDINTIIDSLRGSCQTLDESLPDEMEFIDLTKEDFDQLDGEIFLCEDCGWWCEEYENTGDNICDDCRDA